MILTSIEKMSEAIGYDIGNSNDEVQANLLNGFCKAISNSMQENDRSTQCCYIADKLNNTTLKVLDDIVEFIKLKNKDVK